MVVATANNKAFVCIRDVYFCAHFRHPPLADRRHATARNGPSCCQTAGVIAGRVNGFAKPQSLFCIYTQGVRDAGMFDIVEQSPATRRQLQSHAADLSIGRLGLGCVCAHAKSDDVLGAM